MNRRGEGQQSVERGGGALAVPVATGTMRVSPSL